MYKKLKEIPKTVPEIGSRWMADPGVDPSRFSIALDGRGVGDGAHGEVVMTESYPEAPVVIPGWKIEEPF
jgi:hypothetical protein